MSIGVNKYIYVEQKPKFEPFAMKTPSKKLLFERVGGLHFYVAEDYDEKYLVENYVRKAQAPKTFILKDGHGRVLAKYETVNIELSKRG